MLRLGRRQRKWEKDVTQWGFRLGVTESNARSLMMHFCGNMAMKAAHPLMKKEMDVASICLEGQPETFSSLCTVFFLFPAPRQHDIDCLGNPLQQGIYPADAGCLAEADKRCG